MSYSPQFPFKDAANSTATPLSGAATYTGAGVLSTRPAIMVQTKSDVSGTLYFDFSVDGTNWDSTYPTSGYACAAGVPEVHTAKVDGRYYRIRYVNDSGAQSYFRLGTYQTDDGVLRASLNQSIGLDGDATTVRPTDYNTEVAVGLRSGHVLWNKFGYNEDVDVGTEVIASWGGSFDPITTASVLSIVSDSAADDDGSTGCNSVVIYGLDANRDEAIEVVTMNGTTPVVTTSTWLGVNRVAMYLCGSGKVNAGTITVTETNGSTTMAQMPASGGVTQQCIFYIPRNTTYNMEWLYANSLRQASQDPKVTIKVWVYSTVNNGKQEVFRASMDTSVTTQIDINPNLPFPVSESSVVWMEATTDKANTIIKGRFSGILISD